MAFVGAAGKGSVQGHRLTSIRILGKELNSLCKIGEFLSLSLIISINLPCSTAQYVKMCQNLRWLKFRKIIKILKYF